MIRRLAALTTLAGGLALTPAATAAIHDPVPIGPNEAFVGLVNGLKSNATIQMGCFGPVRPGEVGHPFAGQSTEVELTGPAAVSGFTGSARSIRATFASPTPAASAPQVLATFGSYYVKVAIPTTSWLPCAGSGKIAFTPVNGGPHARSFNVSVSFAGQP